MCRICKKYFDIDKIPADEWIQPAQKRYYHAQCYKDWKDPSKNKDDEDWGLLIYDFLARDLKV